MQKKKGEKRMELARNDISSISPEQEISALLAGLEATGRASKAGLVAYGGSTSYGLDTEDSDVDLRGFFLPTAHDLLMFDEAGTIEVKEGVDGVMHSAYKLTSLLLAGNPNIVEILGLRPEHVLVSSPEYETVLSNKDVYLSSRVADTFGGYATQQLRRIENSMSRDRGDTDTEGALRSMRSAIRHFEDKYTAYNEPGALSVELKDDEAGSSALFVSLDMKDFPLKQLRGMCGDLDAIAKNADNLAARNRKKKTEKLSKHMSHLVRLLRMGTEMLSTGEVNTYREHDAEILLALKQGLWMSEDADGTRHIDDAFWELLEEEKRAFEYAEANTVLPESPDRDAAFEILREMHKGVLATGELW